MATISTFAWQEDVGDILVMDVVTDDAEDDGSDD